MMALDGLMLLPARRAGRAARRPALRARSCPHVAQADQLPHVRRPRDRATVEPALRTGVLRVFPVQEALLSEHRLVPWVSMHHQMTRPVTMRSHYHERDRLTPDYRAGQTNRSRGSPTTRRTIPRYPTSSCSPHSAGGARRARQESRRRSAAARPPSRTPCHRGCRRRLGPVRDHRSELMRDCGYLQTILREGSQTARSIRPAHADGGGGRDAHGLLIGHAGYRHPLVVAHAARTAPGGPAAGRRGTRESLEHADRVGEEVVGDGAGSARRSIPEAVGVRGEGGGELVVGSPGPVSRSGITASRRCATVARRRAWRWAESLGCNGVAHRLAPEVDR